MSRSHRREQQHPDQNNPQTPNDLSHGRCLPETVEGKRSLKKFTPARRRLNALTSWKSLGPRLELDAHDPKSIALIRRDAPCPIASGETLLERRDFRPYFENYSFDTAIVDVIWNGYMESLKIAAMADAYEVNVAPHNFNGHLGSLISAHFCAVVPNFKVMEIDIDDVLWKDEIVTLPPAGV